MQQSSRFQLNAWRQRAGVLAVLLLGVMIAHPAGALPLFARQTGMACLACHTVYPELTHFGRMFKLNGYQLDNGKDLTMTTDEGELTLGLPTIPNLALFIMTSYTQLNKALPDSNIPGATGLKDGGFQFPQQISVLYGGKIAPHFGAFAQLTYDDVGNSFSIDNTDFRFANQYVLPNKTSLTLGVSLNNNPTIEDPWNTIQAFGFPYVPPEVSVASLAAPVLSPGGVGLVNYKVAGPVFYALWNEQAYAAFGLYHYANNGTSGACNNAITGTPPFDSSCKNVAANWNPYWRLAYEYDYDRYTFTVGTLGSYFKVSPGTATGTVVPLQGATNNYTDIGEDFQIQFLGEKNSATWKGIYIKEHQTLDAFNLATGPLSNATDWLSYFSTDFTYWYMRRYGFTVGYLSTQGSTDTLLYPSTPTTLTAATTGNPYPVGVTNSAASNPGTSAWEGELLWAPWLNVKIDLQYIHYTKFNGGKDNYDGCAGVCASGGRNASDNNTLYLLMWFAL